MSSPKKIVYKIEEGMDPNDVLCTTYQMRDMYQQMGTAFFSGLDVMNYIQHHFVVKKAPKNARVLDVCCGRCLCLPLFKWQNPSIRSYTGVDIHEPNYRPALKHAGTYQIPASKKFAPNWEGEGEPFYPFEVEFSNQNVAYMEFDHRFDYIIYTASVEHMHKDMGELSLRRCKELLEPGGTMYISSPNTPGEDNQYAAHVYEWGREELREALEAEGFEVLAEYGIVAKARDFQEKLETFHPEIAEMFDRYKEYLPNEWLYSFFPVIYPELADEVLMHCKLKD